MLYIVKQHPHKSPHSWASIRIYGQFKCLKSLAPQDGHISEIANGEFQRSDFLQRVNPAWNFGFAHYCASWR